MILKVIRKIAPKYTLVTKATQASFEGISKPKEIQSGIIENCVDGDLLIPEFREALSKFQLLREAMDCDVIKISKRGITKEIKVNTTFIVASNPKDDFFRDSGTMRDEIPFAEGVLSRFDFLIPLVSDIKKVEDIIEKMDLFGYGANIDLDKYAGTLKVLSLAMKQVHRVTITEPQEKMIKDAFLKHNIKMGKRPLVIPRDIETISRIINMLVTTNFTKRKMVAIHVYQANDSDITKAIDIWDNLIFARKQLYELRDTKEIKTTTELILELISKTEEISTRELRDKVVALNICSEASLYRNIERLIRIGKIKYKGKSTENAKIEILESKHL
jgi:DNA replicative helicase MCM subunit Mcm2 (Cdc46/Mcm family)